jgi:hypothetical protein
MNTVGWPVLSGILVLIAWAVICRAAGLLGRWLVHLRTSLLRRGADSERIRREFESILSDCSKFERLRLGAGLFVNMRRLQGEADERECERTKIASRTEQAQRFVHLGDPDQPLYWVHSNVDLAWFDDKSLRLVEFKAPEAKSDFIRISHHGTARNLAKKLKSIDYLVITHPDADHLKSNAPNVAGCAERSSSCVHASRSLHDAFSLRTISEPLQICS